MPRYRIYNIDAFQWLQERKAKSIQAVVTDPPFGVVEYTSNELKKKASGNGGIWRLPIDYDGHKRNPMPRFTVLRDSDRKKIQSFHGRLAPLLFKTLVPGGHVIIASQNLLSHLVISQFEEAGFEIRGQIIRVVKTLRGGDRPKGAHKTFRDVSVNPRSCCEPWLIFRKPIEGRISDNLKRWGTGALRRPSPDIPFKDLIVAGPARGLEKKIAPHPSLKPNMLMKQIVWASLPLGSGIVLDPFMGSGSTIAAAESLGLKSIGLEVQKTFFSLAKRAIPRLLKISNNGTQKK